MNSNHPDFLNSSNRLFHVSEEGGIKHFEPRPSPSFLPGINGDVVFAISGKLLHNYLLPRDCPRVTYYPSATTIPEDRARFMGDSSADFIVIVESGWYQRIIETALYCYEFAIDDFSVIDEIAGYYIAYKAVTPVAIHPVSNVISAMLERNVELRFTPSLTRIAGAVIKSSMSFSLIRMRNAQP